MISCCAKAKKYWFYPFCRWYNITLYTWNW